MFLLPLLRVCTRCIEGYEGSSPSRENNSLIRRTLMNTMWRKGSLMLFGLLFVLSLSIASFLPIVPAKIAVAAPVKYGKKIGTVPV
jgi:transposase InsO family protein